jgi:hypothetical protein
VVLVLGAAFAACSPPRPEAADTPAPSAEPSPAAEPPVVSLERTPCFGTCPVYRVAIAASGAVRFLGKHNVARPGEVRGEIPPARVDSLVRELEAGGYFDFADLYVMDSPACGAYATDAPTVITSVTLGGRSKTIRHDYGCSGAPPGLARLERRIDEVAGSSRWTGR